MIDRRKLAKKIHKRFDGAIKLSSIFEAICVIIEYLKEEILNDKVVHIENFGTFCTKTRKAGIIAKRNSDEFIVCKSKKHLRFYPHYIFDSLLKTPVAKVKKILGGRPEKLT